MLSGFVLAGTKNLSFKTAKHQKRRSKCEVKARRRRHTLCLASRRNDDIRARSVFLDVCFLVSTGLLTADFLCPYNLVQYLYEEYHEHRYHDGLYGAHTAFFEKARAEPVSGYRKQTRDEPDGEYDLAVYDENDER